ncbi:MAG: hypothetical protein A3F10_01715 [Coxiella sp. RIFCSPHIGHO2_12_FULL_42_15]|nr:MAG: hypothetical protein A3F10_01715 [Coxiella sp. RIFCSPHIGHO2_12_FULL_42_15]
MSIKKLMLISSATVFLGLFSQGMATTYDKLTFYNFPEGSTISCPQDTDHHTAIDGISCPTSQPIQGDKSSHRFEGKDSEYNYSRTATINDEKGNLICSFTMSVDGDGDIKGTTIAKGAPCRSSYFDIKYQQPKVSADQ